MINDDFQHPYYFPLLRDLAWDGINPKVIVIAIPREGEPLKIRSNSHSCKAEIKKVLNSVRGMQSEKNYCLLLDKGIRFSARL